MLKSRRWQKHTEWKLISSREYVGDDEKESMKRDIAIEKAVEFIMDNVKERAKAED